MGDVSAVGWHRRSSVAVWAAVSFPARWVRRWRLWQLPSRVVALVVTVHLVTAGATASTAWTYPIADRQWLVAGVLLGFGVVQLELSRNLERRRERSKGAGPYHDLKTVWLVAALLLLPPILATAIVVVTHAYGYLRIFGSDQSPHRWAYSCATVVFATQCAIVVLAFGTSAYPGLPEVQYEYVVVIAAITARWFFNYILIIFVSGLMQPDTTFKDAFGQIGEQVTEAAASALALAVAGLLVAEYYVIVAMIYVVIFVMQRMSAYYHFQRKATFDQLTGLYLGGPFTDRAELILERATYRDDTLGLLVLDLDDFKKINDTHGHQIGDKVLVAAADAIKQEIRGETDIPARWGGEEFLVLLPDIGSESLQEVAERIRLRIVHSPVVYVHKDIRTKETSARQVSVTASIGAVLWSRAEENSRDEGLHDIVRRADARMYMAKQSGKNQVCYDISPEDEAELLAGRNEPLIIDDLM